MVLIDYQTPEHKPPRLPLRVFAGLAGAGFMLLAAMLFLAAIGFCVQVINATRAANSGDGVALVLAALVFLQMSIAFGWISLQLIIVAIRNVGEPQGVGAPKPEHLS